jgi:hypothetical protein
MLLWACGEDTLIVLEVDSDLSVPDQINALEIVLTSPIDGIALKTVELALESKHDFPLEVGFFPNDKTPNVLEGRVTGELDDTPVAQIEVRFNWQSGKLNRVELFPLEPL